MSYSSLKHFGQDTAVGRSVWASGCGLEGKITALHCVLVPIWPAPALFCAPAVFQMAAPWSQKGFTCCDRGQASGEPLVLLVLFRQTNTFNLCGFSSCTSAKFIEITQKYGLLKSTLFFSFFFLPEVPSMVSDIHQPKCPSRWRVPLTLLAARERGSFHVEILRVSQINCVCVFAGVCESSRGVAGTRLARRWALSASGQGDRDKRTKTFLSVHWSYWTLPTQTDQLCTEISIHLCAWVRVCMHKKELREPFPGQLLYSQ